ncbi:MAG: putative cytosolic non-specific dipeptidase dipeptidase 2 [Actinomycetia bacterium]|nr:putative cytosolic non-specific dipeptidase dipeptidase 2 [Actinomycetes bacterium]
MRDKVKALMPRARTELAELVAMKSVADPRQFPAEGCHTTASWVAAAFQAEGFADVALHETPDGSKAVIGSRPGPPGSPTVLLYCHYDVQPPLDDAAWESPPWQLTERDGRWYGRGAADCKGNILMHLTALRALGSDLRVGVKLVAEGSEEQGTGGLEAFVPLNRELLRADAIIIGDTGNFAVGVPTFTTTLRGIADVIVTVTTMKGALHSGMFGGPSPDALGALIHMLGSIHDAAGNLTVHGLDASQVWDGVQYPAEQYRADAGVLDGVGLAGDGKIADMLWARPAITVLGIDCPPVVGSSAAVQATAKARLNLRVPPGIDPAAAYAALAKHLEAAAPLQARVVVEKMSLGSPFRAKMGGPAETAMAAAMRESYGREPATQGHGGSIPLCNVFQETFPDAEIMLIGVEEPKCLIHAPNESVEPSEIEHMALAEALFLQNYS